MIDQGHSLVRRLVGSLGAVVLLTAAFAGPVAADAPRPMHGDYTVLVVPVEQRCGPNALTLGFEGMGIATHLGRLEGTGSNCTTFDLASDAVPIWDGRATFVAADGSSISMTYEGAQAAPVNGSAAVSSTFTVISGTGRFEGATGSWTSSGVIDFVTGQFAGSFSGWITY